MTGTETGTEIEGLTFTEALSDAHRQILTPQACALVADLARTFTAERDALLARREERQAEFDAGALPDFLPETQRIRSADWRVAELPADLRDRRVEITGPVDRKMIINALNANVKVFMADFEDSLSPVWQNVIDGQINLRDAVARTISFSDPKSGKSYSLNDNPATLICRVRGIHLPERHVLLDGEPIPGCLLDFALYLLHNAAALKAIGSGPYFYIPKLESHLEARWWNSVILRAQEQLGLPVGTARVTCLIETLPAVFEMDEILYELKDHIAALNCGRWDYIFSYIKTLRQHADRVLPDRQQVTMDKPFLSAYSRLLIRTCHRRGALAMGGMSAFIPLKDAAANAEVLNKVRLDKEREARDGHDGTWIAHPGLAEVVQEIFAKQLGRDDNQLGVLRDNDGEITAAELLAPCPGDRTEAGMRSNIRVSLQYLEAWISGVGCVPIYGLMEDAATAEISRTSIWQWIRTGQQLDNGKTVTADLFRQMLAEETETVRRELGEERFQSGRFPEAAELFERITTADELTSFLTLPGYEML